MDYVLTLISVLAQLRLRLFIDIALGAKGKAFGSMYLAQNDEYILFDM